ncbi:MAG TPA: hypothetical protein VFE33_08185 [Thermoanaerobaculia bacterium]|nr:hypothetical protein [Thermoanaerobaculia bacterium]
MPTLRLTQTAVGEDLHRVEISLEGDGLARQTADVRFPFRFSDDDQRDLRWYLEDYLQAPEEPRVEIVTGVREATSIPWELLRELEEEAPVALCARSFVRAQPNPAEPPKLPTLRAGTPLRILLVICRPYGRDDVPFRSVSAGILKSLPEKARQVFDFDVLRPPTFEALAATLHRAHAAGKPYQIVHFDGHGGFFDMERFLARLREKEEKERALLAEILQLDLGVVSPLRIGWAAHSGITTPIHFEFRQTVTV